MCISLEELSLPESLETIGSNAFGDCYSIEKIVLPDSIRSIGDYAFAFCINIESINIPSGLSVMNEGILSGCYSLKSISIPANVKSIKEGAVEICLSLEDVYIYSPIADIEDRAIDTEGIRFSDITAAEYYAGGVIGRCVGYTQVIGCYTKGTVVSDGYCGGLGGYGRMYAYLSYSTMSSSFTV